jgi:hypothetical protein
MVRFWGIRTPAVLCSRPSTFSLATSTSTAGSMGMILCNYSNHGDHCHVGHLVEMESRMSRART